MLGFPRTAVLPVVPDFLISIIAELAARRQFDDADNICSWAG